MMGPFKRADRTATNVCAKTVKLEALIREYGHVIRCAVRKAGGRRLGSSLEDVEQSVLLEVWKQVQREQEILFPTSYLYRSAVRETVRLIKRSQSRNEEGLTGEVGAGPELASNHRPALDLEMREAIDSGLGALRPERRKAVEAHLAGYSVDEIMDSFDWSYSRARNLIARGMADLRKKLRHLGVER